MRDYPGSNWRSAGWSNIDFQTNQNQPCTFDKLINGNLLGFTQRFAGEWWCLALFRRAQSRLLGRCCTDGKCKGESKQNIGSIGAPDCPFIYMPLHAFTLNGPVLMNLRGCKLRYTNFVECALVDMVATCCYCHKLPQTWIQDAGSRGTAPVLKSSMLLDPRFQPCLRAVRTGKWMDSRRAHRRKQLLSIICIHNTVVLRVENLVYHVLDRYQLVYAVFLCPSVQCRLLHWLLLSSSCWGCKRCGSCSLDAQDSPPLPAVCGGMRV